MDTSQAERALDLRPGARGRKGKDKQEAVIKLETIKTRVPELVVLKKKLDDASKDFCDAIKKAAEDSRLLAVTVRRFVIAKAGHNFDEAKDKAKQLALVFEEVE